MQWLAHREQGRPWEAKVSTFAALLLLPILSLSSCTDGSSFSIEQTPELNLQRGGNVGWPSLPELQKREKKERILALHYSVNLLTFYF